jgi:benzodiazapine receptor
MRQCLTDRLLLKASFERIEMRYSFFSKPTESTLYLRLFARSRIHPGRGKPMRWIVLIFWLALCFAVAGISGRWTAAEVAGWYRTLHMPAIAPPNWVFGPVWTLLYALMAVATWRVTLTQPSHARNWALGLFLVQLALNFAWSLIFFRLHAIGPALAEILVLWAFIGASTLAFVRLNPTAAWMMAPYWAWVSFASLLNAQIWRLNRG